MGRQRRHIPNGTRFNNFVVIEELKPTSWGTRRFKCQCDCGGVSVVFMSNLGKYKSCKKCYGKYSELFKQFPELDPGSIEQTHVWQVWHSMKTKVGARGIDVCEEWEEFYPYLEHYTASTGLTLREALLPRIQHSFFHAKRVDENKPWSPENTVFFKFVTERARDEITYKYWYELKQKELLATELLSYKEFLNTFGVKRGGWRLARHDITNPHSKHNSYWKANARRTSNSREEHGSEPGAVD